MTKIIHEFFTRNIGWKIFSIISAVVMWYVIINITNPMEIRTISTKIVLENQDSLAKQNLVISNLSKVENSFVNVKVRGAKMALDDLRRNSSKVEAKIDLKSAYYGATADDPNHIPINVTVPSGFEVVDKDPIYLEVVFEEVKTVQKEISFDRIGEPKNNFITLQPTFSPDTVNVKGASSIISKLDSVKVSVDVSNIDSNLSVKAEPKAYDADGNQLSDLNIVDANGTKISEVQIDIPVNEYKKIPIDSSSYIGMPADGYTLVDIVAEPKYAEIVGSSENIAKLNVITIEPINISGLNMTKTESYPLRNYLPDNIDIKNGTSSELIVTIKIAKEETKEFEIPINDLNISGSSANQYTFNQDTIKLSLKAISSVMDTIKTENIKCSIDLSEYGEGTHEIPVSVTVPLKSSLVGTEPTVNITINNSLQTEAESNSTETDETESLPESTQASEPTVNETD